MIIGDYHVHSDFSSDSKTPMEEMIKKAIGLGLKKICFTDHMDYDFPVVTNYSFVFDIDKYVAKLKDLKERYQQQIDILTGIELGLQPHLTHRLNKLTTDYAFDFIIGSSHVVNQLDPYYPEYWEKTNKEEGLRKYFETIITNCKAFHNFHVYGHMDYIIRYVPERLYDANDTSGKADYSYNDYRDLLDEALKTIISSGKGIEINTSGLKYGLGYTHPKGEVIKRYKELGGEIITIGSDGHKPEHLAYDFFLVPQLLKAYGFSYYTLYKEGKPIFEKL